MMLLGHDLMPAVVILTGWLEQYRQELAQSPLQAASESLQNT